MESSTIGMEDQYLSNDAEYESLNAANVNSYSFGTSFRAVVF